jgi:hypothetical protein
MHVHKQGKCQSARPDPIYDPIYGAADAVDGAGDGVHEEEFGVIGKLLVSQVCGKEDFAIVGEVLDPVVDGCCRVVGKGSCDAGGEDEVGLGVGGDATRQPFLFACFIND